MTHPTADLDRLVDGIRERSDEAFSAVYQLTASGLVSYASGMLRDRQAAEDAVQQAFLELSSAASSFRGDGRALRAWLYRSVWYSCLDELRRRRRRPEHPSDALPETAVFDTPSLPDPALREAISRLTEQQQSIVLLRYVADLPIDEIARVLDSNRTAVYAASARAERRLRKLLSTVESERSAASSPIDDGAERERLL